MTIYFTESRTMVRSENNASFDAITHDFFSAQGADTISISISAISGKSESPVLQQNTIDELDRIVSLFSQADEMLIVLESIKSIEFCAIKLDNVIKKATGNYGN